MDKVLIAYNNDSTTILHDFLESCADEAKQICADNGSHRGCFRKSCDRN